MRILRNLYAILKYHFPLVFNIIRASIHRTSQIFRKVQKPVLLQTSYSENSDTICALPWTHNFINELGHNFPCCISTDNSLPNVDKNGRPYRAFETNSFENTWNSDYMKDLRLKMMTGQRPKPCERCYKIEDLGISSPRHWANQKWASQLDAALKDTTSDGKAPLRFYSADIRLGNNCNLRCRMCSPTSSKGLATEWHKMGLLIQKERDHFLTLDWFEKPEFWEKFLTYSKDLKTLHFAGGEPFLIKQHFSFLKNLIERKISQDLVLSYNTNLTVLPEELLVLWKEFESIDLLISLDGTSEVNQYIRFPSNWESIHKNIRFVYNNMKIYNIKSIKFNVTVQIYNIYDLPKLLDLLVTEYPQSGLPMLSPLFNPQELSLQILPEKEKIKLTCLLKDYLIQRKLHWREVKIREDEIARIEQSITGLVQFMNEKDRSNLLSKFKSRTRAFDFQRKQSCAKTIPELAYLFE